MSYSLRNPILATIVYYDVFQYPLTLFEVYKFLINPARILHRPEGIGDIDINNIAEELDKLASSGIIGQKNGFYFLQGKEALYDLRMYRDKISSAKWKKFLRMIRFLSIAPYLRGIFTSGSMAINNADKESDFDILVITKSGRLYTCRFFLWLISSVMGTRRKKFERVAPDKLCFNHYITDDSLYIPHESIFNAQTYSNLKPVMIGKPLFDKFFSNNLWINNYIYNFQPQYEFVRLSAKVNIFFHFVSYCGEVILNTFLGKWLESKLRKIQQDRIRKDPKTYESGGRIIFNEKELEFHPHSFEKVVLEKYKSGLRRLGIASFIDEKDSGLKN